VLARHLPREGEARTRRAGEAHLRHHGIVGVVEAVLEAERDRVAAPADRWRDLDLRGPAPARARRDVPEEELAAIEQAVAVALGPGADAVGGHAPAVGDGHRQGDLLGRGDGLVGRGREAHLELGLLRRAGAELPVDAEVADGLLEAVLLL